MVMPREQYDSRFGDYLGHRKWVFLRCIRRRRVGASGTVLCLPGCIGGSSVTPRVACTRHVGIGLEHTETPFQNAMLIQRNPASTGPTRLTLPRNHVDLPLHLTHDRSIVPLGLLVAPESTGSKNHINQLRRTKVYWRKHYLLRFYEALPSVQLE